MIEVGLELCSTPSKWPYSWTTVVQRFDQFHDWRLFMWMHSTALSRLGSVKHGS